MVKPAQTWSTQQLAEFLDLVPSFRDEQSAMLRAAERVAEALQAEVAAVVRGGEVEASVGFPQGEAPVERLVAIAEGSEDSLELAGVGACGATHAPIEGEGSASIVVARFGSEPFTREEMSLLRGMARVLAMSVLMLRGLAKERDLRERSEFEARERRQAEAKYRTLVERLPAIVYTAEVGAHGAWTYVSPQIEDILGFSRDEWLADPEMWLSRLHPDDRSRALAAEDSTALGDRDPAPIDYRMYARDGSIVWILDEAVLERNPDGKPVWHGVLYDITDRKNAEEELKRRAAQQAAVAGLGERALEGANLATLMEMAVSVVVEVEDLDCGGVFELVPDAHSVLLRAGVGCPADAIGNLRFPVGKSSSQAGFALDMRKTAIVDDWKTEDRFGQPAALQDMEVRSSITAVIEGAERPFGVFEVHSRRSHRFTPEDANFVQSVANVLADAIERQAADEEMRHQALHDSLTGLPNRVLFGDRLAQALAHSRRRGASVAVLFLDLDHFKLINDSLGHATGDELLKAVAPRLRQRLRPSDTVARFGGDEFGILIDDAEDERDAIAVAERIGAAFTRPFVLNHVEHFISASIGISLATSGSELPEALVRDADAAMYRAKERGRARYELFDEVMRARAVERLEVEHELRRAIEQEEFVLHYQPVVSIASNEIVGFEALIRWQHPVRGMVPPGEFIPVAEDSALIEPIGAWVLQEACRQAAEWHRARPDARPVHMSINLSARQFVQRDLADHVAAILSSTGMDAGLLHLEITESALIEESDAPMVIIKELKALGIKLVLDDFGTGFSSLGYVNRFPIDVLKIDRSFVDGLGVVADRTAIVEAIVAMAQALSLGVVAEGVEDEGQLAELKRLGCECAQGFYFSRPVPADEVDALLAQGALQASD